MIRGEMVRNPHQCIVCPNLRLCFDNYRSLRWSQSVITAIFAMMLTGCIPHPTVPEELPFEDDEIAFIELGVTTRQQVQQKLGSPLLTRAGDRIAIYGKVRNVAGVITVVGTAEPIVSVHDFIVQYGADGVVQTFDVIRGDEGCTSDGICVKAVLESREASGWWFDSEIVQRDAILFAHPEEDDVAKSFPVYAEQCSIYFYETGDKVILQVERSGRGRTLVDEEGYLHWIAEPGSVMVAAATYTWVINEAANDFRLDCVAERIYFLRATIDNKVFGDDTLTFSVDEMETGMQFVSERRLIID